MTAFKTISFYVLKRYTLLLTVILSNIFFLGGIQASEEHKEEPQKVYYSKSLTTKIITDIGNDDRVYIDFNNSGVKDKNNQPLGVLDHQGHIIPQNKLGRVLFPDHTLLNARRAKKPWVFFSENFNNFFLSHFFGSLEPIKNGLLKRAPQNVLLKTEKQKNFYLGTLSNDMLQGYLYSKIIWNPANICRAPSDDRRNSFPGNEVDYEVIGALKNLKIASEPILRKALTSLDAILENDLTKGYREVKNLRSIDDTLNRQRYINFMTAWKSLQELEQGHYVFPWKNTSKIGGFHLMPDVQKMLGVTRVVFHSNL